MHERQETPSAPRVPCESARCSGLATTSWLLSTLTCHAGDGFSSAAVSSLRGLSTWAGRAQEGQGCGLRRVDRHLCPAHPVPEMPPAESPGLRFPTESLQSPHLFVGGGFHGSQWMPEATESSRPYVCICFPTHTPVIVFNLEVRHSKRLYYRYSCNNRL